MKEEDLLPLIADRLDQEFDKGWDAAVRAAFEIVETEVGGLGHERLLKRIHMRFREELEMKED